MSDELQVTVEIRRGLEQPWSYRMILGNTLSAIAPPRQLQREQFERAFTDCMHTALDRLFDPQTTEHDSPR